MLAKTQRFRFALQRVAVLLSGTTLDLGVRDADNQVDHVGELVDAAVNDDERRAAELRRTRDQADELTAEQAERLSIDIEAPLTCGRHISLNDPAPCARPAGHDGPHATLRQVRLEEDINRLST